MPNARCDIWPNTSSTLKCKWIISVGRAAATVGPGQHFLFGEPDERICLEILERRAGPGYCGICRDAGGHSGFGGGNHPAGGFKRKQCILVGSEFDSVGLPSGTRLGTPVYPRLGRRKCGRTRPLRQDVRSTQNRGAIEGTRTPTPLRVHGPEPCASANSATMAISDWDAAVIQGRLPGKDYE